jgi:hypothetical protein
MKGDSELSVESKPKDGNKKIKIRKERSVGMLEIKSTSYYHIKDFPVEK